MSRRFSGSKSLNLNAQIMLAFGSILFLFAIVIGFFFLIASMTSIQESPAIKAQAGGDTLKESLLSAQNSANQFLLHNDMSVAEQNKKITNELLTRAKQVQSNASKSGDKTGASNAGKIITQIQSYNKTFQELVNAVTSKGKDSSSGLQGQLNSVGQQFYTVVSRNEAGSMALALLQIQVEQKEYFRRHGRKSLQNLTAAIRRIDRMARESTIDPLDAQLLRKSLKKYSSAFDRYQAVSLMTNDPSLSSTLGKEQKRQADAMENAAGEIESIITRVNVPDAMDLANKTRQHESEYLLNGTELSIDKFNKALDALINAFNDSSILQEHKNEFIRSAIQYRGAFKALVNNDNSIKALTEQLNKTSSSLVTQIASAPKSTAGMRKSSAGKVSSQSNNLVYIATCAGLTVILLGLIVALLLGRFISTPISSMTAILRRIISDKDFSVEIPVSSKNEIGSLAVELNNLLRLQQDVALEAVDRSKELSANMSELQEATNILNTHIKNATDKNVDITNAVTGRDEITSQVNETINQMMEAAENVARISSQSNEQNEKVTGSIEQISKSVEATLAGIQAITQSSSQISDIINLSTDIAEQTNLLALNASVKAARAGSHGKEFAQIADEIAKLAQRSEEVAKEAKQLTSDLTSRVDESITLGDDTKKALEEIHEAGESNVSSAQEIASQTEEVINSTNELTEKIDKLASVINEVETKAQEQSRECVGAQEAIANLLAAYSTNQSLDSEEENKPDLPMKELIDNIAISIKEDEHTDDEIDENEDAFETEQTEQTDNIIDEDVETNGDEAEDSENDK